jgi:hypothetical protein
LSSSGVEETALKYAVLLSDDDHNRARALARAVLPAPGVSDVRYITAIA